MPVERIRATLPTLGAVNVLLYDESSEVLGFFGKSELNRLDRVDHLGVAAAAFTGVNHTRLEYTLLQCALIQQTADLHKDHPELALSSPVTLDGLRSRVSSGEELLKSWTILSSAGRPKWTYGVERGILQAALNDSDVRRWLVTSTRIPDLRKWCRDQIDQYNDDLFHFVLTLRRIANGKPYDRRKTRFAHLLRNLLLEPEHLLKGDSDARRKLGRLRQLYQRIRLIAIVTLDSYYSHHPFNLSPHSTLNSLKDLAGNSPVAAQFERSLRQVAGWLANDIYLHPDACAVQRDYECRMEDKFSDSFHRSSHSEENRRRLLKSLMNDGMGKPPIDNFKPLVRITVNPSTARRLRLSVHESDIRELRNRLCEEAATNLAVNRNPFSDEFHLDLFYSEENSKDHNIADVLVSLVNWLLRAVETDALTQLRGMLPPNLRGTKIGPDQLDRLKANMIQRNIARQRHLFESFFFGAIQYLLPEGWEAHVVPELPSKEGDPAVRAKVRTPSGVGYDDLTYRVKNWVDENPDGLPNSRLHELRGLKRLLPYRSGQLVVGSVEALKLYDVHGKARDDWDATLLEVTDTEVALYVVEGKMTRRSREGAAFRQLEETCQILKPRASRYRRRRLKGLGARAGFHLECS